MATTQPLTDAIMALTTYANNVTGASDTTLSDAVRTLADGFDGGGGSGIPLLKSETVAANTRYVNIDLTPYLAGKQFVILVINFELTASDWLYYAINASAPQTSGQYGNNKATSHNTIPFLYGDLGGYGQTCVLTSSGNVFVRYSGNEAINNFMINTYYASISIKAGSTYSIYGM